MQAGRNPDLPIVKRIDFDFYKFKAEISLTGGYFDLA